MLIRILKFLLKYFLVLPAFYFGGAYLLALKYCAPGTAGGPGLISGGSTPTGGPTSSGGFDLGFWMIAAGMFAVVLILIVDRLIASRYSRLIAVAWLVDRYESRDEESYIRIWLRRRIIGIWRSINPSDKKKTVKAIADCIRAGHGLDPAEWERLKREERKERRESAEEDGAQAPARFTVHQKRAEAHAPQRLAVRPGMRPTSIWPLDGQDDDRRASNG